MADEAVSNCCSCDLCVAPGFHVPRRLVVALTHSSRTLTQAFEFQVTNGIAFPVKRGYTTIETQMYDEYVTIMLMTHIYFR